jgi:hypothetical protein
LKAKSPLVTQVGVAPLVVAILSLTACVKYPVGDPEKSKVDPKLSGAWCYQQANSKTLLFIRPYDSRTYFVKSLSYEEESGVVRPGEQQEFKAWLTTLGGADFFTMELLDCAAFAGLNTEKPPYFVAKADLADGSLRLHLVNGEQQPAKAAASRSELEAAIVKNVGSDALYAGQPLVFGKLEDKARIESVVKAFRR